MKSTPTPFQKAKQAPADEVARLRSTVPLWERPFLNIIEAAALMGITIFAVRTLIRDGKLKIVSQHPQMISQQAIQEYRVKCEYYHKAA